MKNQQSGFTLIELIAVLVILGILAATAAPKFINLSDESYAVATSRMAASLESAGALNHAVDIAKEAGLSTDTVTDVGNCDESDALLNGGALPTGYTLNDSAIADKASATCTLTHTATSTAETFTMIGAAN